MTKKKLEQYYKCLPILLTFVKEEKQKGNNQALKILEKWDIERNRKEI